MPVLRQSGMAHLPTTRREFGDVQRFAAIGRQVTTPIFAGAQTESPILETPSAWGRAMILFAAGFLHKLIENLDFAEWESGKPGAVSR